MNLKSTLFFISKTEFAKTRELANYHGYPTSEHNDVSAKILCSLN